jgi:Domain of unknown function (DUF4349)
MGVPELRSPGLRVLLVLFAAVALGVAACSGGASSQVLSTVGNSIGSEADRAAASAAPAAEAPEAGGIVPGQDDGGNPPSALRDDLKIVYTGSLQLVVADLQAALAKAKAAVAATGGYIGASQESNDDAYAVATITYRIPATRWEDAIGTLRDLATNVVAEQTQATEVGGQIVDLDARIRNLRASEASLQEIAKGAGKISDLLEVEAQLTQVRGEIEQLEGQRAQLQDQVSYGTLVATFGTEIVQVQQTAQAWDPASDVDAAFATLIGAGQAIVSAAIWFGLVWLPVLLVLVLLALVARWVFRRFVPASRPAAPVAGWGDGSGG